MRLWYGGAVSERAGEARVRPRDEYGQLLATGLTTVVAVQTLIIVGGNLKLIPLTGVTLSFVSYGGSSLITSYMLLALLLKIPASERR